MLRYRFGDFVMEVSQGRLRRRIDGGVGEPVPLPPRLFDALQYLVEHPGELLDKETLFGALWPGLVVEENSLSQTISGLRRALGDEPQDSRYIQTVPRRGFRFVAEVTIDDAPATPSDPNPQAPALDDGDRAQAFPSVPPAAVEDAGRSVPPHPAHPVERRRFLLGIAASGVGAVAVTVAGAWAWGSRTAAGERTMPTTLAVLPFKPLVLDARDEVLELGMADSLVARLSTLPGVAVRSIGSVRRYAGPEQDPLRAARELDVAWVVDGSIQRWGSQVRVTARLLDASSGEAAWSGAFDEQFTSVFDLQDAISMRVSQVLAPHLSANGRRRLAGTGGTRNIDAYQSYLAARHQAQGIRTAGLVKSIALYRQAIALDPRFALAYAGLAESNRRMIFGADAEPRVVFEEAKEYVGRAIALDPDLAEGYSSAAWNRFWYDWDWSGAERTFQRAIALNASEVNAHFGYGQLLDTLGRSTEAAEQKRVARELDPQSLILLTIESGSLYWSGKPAEGRRRLQRVFDLEPDFWVAHLTLGMMLVAEQKIDEGIETMERADRLADGSSQAAAALGFVLARNGHEARARGLLTRFAEAARTRYLPPTSAGLIHAGLGERDAALAALERGLAVRDVRMTLVPLDSRWTLVRDEPRYRAILERMNLKDRRS